MVFFGYAQNEITGVCDGFSFGVLGVHAAPVIPISIGLFLYSTSPGLYILFLILAASTSEWYFARASL